MKYLTLIALIALSGCIQPSGVTPVPNPGLPTLNCTVANFTSDTGETDFIRDNRRKRFEIISTPDGFISNVTSAEFSNSTVDFAVTQVGEDQLFAQKRSDTADDTLTHTMVIDRMPTNGTWRAIQSVNSTFPNLDLPPSSNVWTLACRAAA